MKIPKEVIEFAKELEVDSEIIIRIYLENKKLYRRIKRSPELQGTLQFLVAYMKELVNENEDT